MRLDLDQVPPKTCPQSSSFRLCLVIPCTRLANFPHSIRPLPKRAAFACHRDSPLSTLFLRFSMLHVGERVALKKEDVVISAHHWRRGGRRCGSAHHGSLACCQHRATAAPVSYADSWPISRPQHLSSSQAQRERKQLFSHHGTDDIS